MRYYFSGKEINNLNPSVILSLSKDDLKGTVTLRQAQCDTFGLASTCIDYGKQAQCKNVILSLSKDDLKGTVTLRQAQCDTFGLASTCVDYGKQAQCKNVILSLSKDDLKGTVTLRQAQCDTLRQVQRDILLSVLRFKLPFNFIIIFLLSLNSFLFGQQNWFPKELNVQPFTANFLEPKAGFLFNTSDNKIRLDIGTSQDILHIKNQDDIFSFGADLFTFTRLRSEDDFHFPVETIDYLFGLNASYKRVLNDNEYGLRFRFSHISAHLVDGQFDKATNQWRDGRLPQVYSREFIELFPFIRFYDTRFYVGITYIFHSSPKEVKKGIFQIGGDYFITKLSNQVFTPFVAYDFKLSGKEKYVGNNFINFGLKFGEFNKKGFSIYYSYISGKSVHGEYFDLNENYSSIGFNLDL